MHELAIAAAIVEAVEQELGKIAGVRPRSVAVRIGVLAGVDREALQFAFDALIRNTTLAEMTLGIESRPLRYWCSRCGDSFVVSDFVFDCPRCGTASAQCIGGQELELADLEVEDEPAAARA